MISNTATLLGMSLPAGNRKEAMGEREAEIYAVQIRLGVVLSTENLARFIEAQDARVVSLEGALRPFLNCAFPWEQGGQITPWITREEWEAARAVLSGVPDAEGSET